MKSKKSQMEVLGLAIIVLFIVIILVFVLRFVILREPQDVKGDYNKIQMSTNVINTYLKTTTDCYDLSVTELLQDCVEGKSVGCALGNSCDASQDVAETIFNKTLDEWKYKYNFRVFLDENSPIFILGTDCNRSWTAKEFPVPTNLGKPIIARMRLC